MNNSKKLRTKKEKEIKKSEKPITSISKKWIIPSLVLIVVLIGAILFDQLYTPNILKVDGKNYNLKDLSYYFYTVESKYASYNSMFGGESWDLPISEDGTTMREEAKKDAVNESLRAIILSNEAVKKGYKLTEEEKKTVKTTVDNLYKQLSKTVIRKNHFSKSYLTKMIEGTTLVTRYRQDKLAEAKIDKDKIKAGVSQEEFRQYKVEYFYAATESTDSDGKTKKFTDTEKKNVFDKLSSYYDKSKTTKDWSKLVPTTETAIIYKTLDFIKEDTTTFSDDVKAKIMKMNNGDVSELVESTNGYYIVRMIDNNSKARYDSEVSAAIATAENQAFDKVYEEVKKEHPNKLNNGSIKRLKLGSLTIE